MAGRPLTRLEREILFARLLPRLFDEIWARGYECVINEARSQRVSLALYRHGTPIGERTHFEGIGAFWESLHPRACWSGNAYFRIL